MEVFNPKDDNYYQVKNDIYNRCMSQRKVFLFVSKVRKPKSKKFNDKIITIEYDYLPTDNLNLGPAAFKNLVYDYLNANGGWLLEDSVMSTDSGCCRTSAKDVLHLYKFLENYLTKPTNQVVI